MNRKILALLLLATSAVIAIAEPDVCKLVRRKYDKNAHIRVEIDQSSYWSVREKTSRKRGTVVLAPGNRFRVEMANETFVSDGTTLLHFDRNNNQLTIRNLAELDRTVLPSYFLTHFLDDYRFTEKERSGDEVTLFWSLPQDEDTSTGIDGYRSITLTAKTSSGILVSIVAVDRNDNVHTYNFRKTVFGRAEPDEVFHFEVPPDANIVDNRR